MSARSFVVAVLLSVTMAACGAPDPTPVPSTQPASSAPSASASTSAEPTPRDTPAPTPTLAPHALPAIESRDERPVALEVLPALAEQRLILRVTNNSDERIDEIAVRWPADIAEYVRLTPNTTPLPNEPLQYPWTRWVLGPGVRGEPADTVTLGWGPIEPGQTLDIDLRAQLAAEAEVPAFQLQVLSDDTQATGPDGEALQVEIDLQ